jgi:hypothetical protein
MKPKCSLPRSQQPATCPYLQLHHFSPRFPPPSYLIQIHFNIILFILIFILLQCKLEHKNDSGRNGSSIPYFQTAVSFFINSNFTFLCVCVCVGGGGCSQIPELRHNFKGRISYFHVVTFFPPAFWSRDMTIYSVFSAFSSRTIS